MKDQPNTVAHEAVRFAVWFHKVGYPSTRNNDA